MKGKVKYVYPYSALTYRPSITVSSTVEVSASPWRQQSSTGTYSVSPTLDNGKWADVVDSVDFDFSLSSNNPIKSGLVLEYLFYEGSGTTLHDTSGNGNNGTIYGATWKQLSNGKWALYFDGVDDYVSMPNYLINNLYGDNQNLPNYMTIEALFKPLNKVWGLVGATGGEAFVGGGAVIPYIYSGTDYQIRMSQWAGAVAILNTNVYTSQSFFHITAVYKHTSNNVSIVEGYVNGQFKGTHTRGITGWASAEYNYLGTVCAGGTWEGSCWAALKGYITLVRIFNYALSSSEVSTLYNMAKQLIP